MQNEGHKKIPPSRLIAFSAVMCAILIGGQYVFSFVAGVEIVTLLLVCFSYVFGVRQGAICAVAFSVLRCFIYGFYPAVIILYLIYYPLLAVLFGALGHIKESTFENYPWYFALFINLLLLGIAVACLLCNALDLINISRIYKVTVCVLLWVIFALCIALCITFNALLTAKKVYKKNTAKLLKLITVVTIAAFCTVLFTLLDDVISPLFLGLSKLSALAYFYSSFLAMLPQTICTIATVSTLFLPLTAVMQRANNVK